jgi:hypothetical protein
MRCRKSTGQGETARTRQMGGGSLLAYDILVVLSSGNLAPAAKQRMLKRNENIVMTLQSWTSQTSDCRESHLRTSANSQVHSSACASCSGGCASLFEQGGGGWRLNRWVGRTLVGRHAYYPGCISSVSTPHQKRAGHQQCTCERA